MVYSCLHPTNSYYLWVCSSFFTPSWSRRLSAVKGQTENNPALSCSEAELESSGLTWIRWNSTTVQASFKIQNWFSKHLAKTVWVLSALALKENIWTLPHAPSPWSGSCRYISRFASWPTNAVRQRRLIGARQADCSGSMINVLHMLGYYMARIWKLVCCHHHNWVNDV